VERDAYCTSSTQLVVERDTPCRATLQGYTLHFYSVGDGKGIHPHVYAGGGKKNTPTSTLLTVDRDTPRVVSVITTPRNYA
jgi:hypothetical protein